MQKKKQQQTTVIAWSPQFTDRQLFLARLHLKYSHNSLRVDWINSHPCLLGLGFSLRNIVFTYINKGPLSELVLKCDCESVFCLWKGRWRMFEEEKPWSLFSVMDWVNVCNTNIQEELKPPPIAAVAQTWVNKSISEDNLFCWWFSTSLSWKGKMSEEIAHQKKWEISVWNWRGEPWIMGAWEMGDCWVAWKLSSLEGEASDSALAESRAWAVVYSFTLSLEHMFRSRQVSLEYQLLF